MFFNFFIRLPPEFLSCVSWTADMPPHLAQPCYVALGQALIWGLYPYELRALFNSHNTLLATASTAYWLYIQGFFPIFPTHKASQLLPNCIYFLLGCRVVYLYSSIIFIPHANFLTLSLFQPTGLSICITALTTLTLSIFIIPNV